MAQFSLIKTLEELYIEPFPTRKFRGIVNLLKNIVTIMEELHKNKVCYLDDFFFKKLTINLEEIKIPKNRFIPSVEAYRLLKENEVPEKFNHLLKSLLLYLIIKLNRCTSEEAASILHDFIELQSCFFDFRKYATWDNSDLDDNILKFQKKLISMLSELNRENRELKFQIFSIIRIIITEIGKHPVYSAPSVENLTKEVSRFYEKVKSRDSNESVSDHVFENHLTCLYILNDIISQNFVNNNKESGKIILLKLKNILNESIAFKKMRSLECYLVHSILRIIEVYQVK